MLFTKIMYLF